MQLQEIFCQDEVLKRLQQAYAAGKMAHAYIFAGPDGVGRRTIARAWAQMLLCQNRQQKKIGGYPLFVDNCGQCESCRVFDSGGHPDFQEIYKELRPYTVADKGKEAKQDLPISVIREFLIDKVASRPTMGEFVVFIVHEAERLNASSQNALLKVLEEPPRHCIIILLCTRPEMLLPTTLSRCQLLRFGPIEEDIIVKRLVEQGVDKVEAVFWARFCEGSLGQAIHWIGLKLKEGSCYSLKTELIRRLAQFQLADTVDLAEWMVSQTKDLGQAFNAVNEQVSKTESNRRALKGVLRMTLYAFKDTMRLSAGMDEGLINADQKELICRIADRNCPETLAEWIATADKSMQWVDDSVNEKLIFEDFLLHCAGCGIVRL
ncbi:MAG: DNA polymerase III subunit [Sedimentisphaerales bacterium]|nr:DNA polymerase III subunit [Sedimentisphaerales bacterium]